jgi:Family of unknown function (DUF6011)
LTTTPTDVETPVEGISFRSIPGKIPNGVFTVIGPRGHRTIKVKTIDSPDKPGLHGRRAVYVMTGPDNLFNYTGVGFLNTVNETVKKTIKVKTTDEFGAEIETDKEVEEIVPRDSFQPWKKQQGTELHKVVIAWFQVFQAQDDPVLATKWKDYRIEEARNCMVCNRLLTTPESIAAGIGPVCAGRP